MYRRILVPLDGSLAAEAALPAAAAIARRTGAQLEIALVHTPVTAGLAADPATASGFDELEAIQLADEARYLARVTGRIHTEFALRVASSRLDGAVVDALATRIREAGVELVVMVTHGRGPVGRLCHGSVADGLLRTTAAPVLLLRADQAGAGGSAVRRVLVPLDRSALAEEALVAAGRLLEPGGECLLLTVLNAEPILAVSAAPVRRPGAGEGDLQSTRTYLERLARRVRRMGLRARVRVSIGWNAAAHILDEAESRRADAIVVTTYGVGGIRRFLLGSVVDRLVRTAPVPVLVCRPYSAHRPRGAARDPLGSFRLPSRAGA